MTGTLIVSIGKRNDFYKHLLQQFFRLEPEFPNIQTIVKRSVCVVEATIFVLVCLEFIRSTFYINYLHNRRTKHQAITKLTFYRHLA